MNHVPPLTSRTDRENMVAMILKARRRTRADIDAEIMQLEAQLREMRQRLAWGQS